MINDLDNLKYGETSKSTPIIEELLTQNKNLD